MKEPVKKEKKRIDGFTNSRLFDFSSPFEDRGCGSETSSLIGCE
jgi:hypothetical protein